MARRSIPEAVEALQASCLPCELQQQQREMAARAAQVIEVPAESEDVATWEGPLTREGEMTGDGRLIAHGALSWDTLPIPLRWSPSDNGAHAGAVVVGRINTIERRDNGDIWATGDFDLGSEHGREAARQLREGLTPGVSVDLDDVSFEVRVSSEAQIDGDPEDIDEFGRIKAMAMNSDDELMITTSGRVRAATMVAIPAFETVRLSMTAGLLGDLRKPLHSELHTVADQLRVPKGNGELSGQWIDMPDSLLKQLGSDLKSAGADKRAMGYLREAQDAISSAKQSQFGTTNYTAGVRKAQAVLNNAFAQTNQKPFLEAADGMRNVASVDWYSDPDNPPALTASFNPAQLRVPKGNGPFSGRWIDMPGTILGDLHRSLRASNDMGYFPGDQHGNFKILSRAEHHVKAAEDKEFGSPEYFNELRNAAAILKSPDVTDPQIRGRFARAAQEIEQVAEIDWYGDPDVNYGEPVDLSRKSVGTFHDDFVLAMSDVYEHHQGQDTLKSELTTPKMAKTKVRDAISAGELPVEILTLLRQVKDQDQTLGQLLKAVGKNDAKTRLADTDLFNPSMLTAGSSFNPDQLRVPKGNGELSGQWIDMPSTVLGNFEINSRIYGLIGSVSGEGYNHNRISKATDEASTLAGRDLRAEAGRLHGEAYKINDVAKKIQLDDHQNVQNTVDSIKKYIDDTVRFAQDVMAVDAEIGSLPGEEPADRAVRQAEANTRRDSQLSNIEKSAAEAKQALDDFASLDLYSDPDFDPATQGQDVQQKKGIRRFLPGHAAETDAFRNVNTKERERLAKKGNAMPDGSFPIANAKDLRNAIMAIGRAKDPDAVKAHIKRRAKELKQEKMIPSDWAATFNWVEKTGGLPQYIKRIAKHVEKKGHTQSQSIAIAVNAVKKMCATGDINFPGKQQVNVGSQAEACEAVAEWEAKKAAAKGVTDEFIDSMLAFSLTAAGLVAGVDQARVPKGNGILSGRWIDMPGTILDDLFNRLDHDVVQNNDSLRIVDDRRQDLAAKGNIFKETDEVKYLGDTLQDAASAPDLSNEDQSAITDASLGLQDFGSVDWYSDPNYDPEHPDPNDQPSGDDGLFPADQAVLDHQAELKQKRLERENAPKAPTRADIEAMVEQRNKDVGEHPPNLDTKNRQSEIDRLNAETEANRKKLDELTGQAPPEKTPNERIKDVQKNTTKDIQKVMDAANQLARRADGWASDHTPLTPEQQNEIQQIQDDLSNAVVGDAKDKLQDIWNRWKIPKNTYELSGMAKDLVEWLRNLFGAVTGKVPNKVKDSGTVKRAGDAAKTVKEVLTDAQTAGEQLSPGSSASFLQNPVQGTEDIAHFINALIHVIGSGGSGVLRASAFPLQPPREWFSDPKLTGPTPLKITADGRVYGHLALWGTCHTGFANQCVTPPSSPSGYAYFRTGAVICADGSEIATGVITMDTLHAGKSLSAGSTIAHYENTGRAAVDCVVGEDAHGIWVAGALRSTLTDEQARRMRGAPLSGDWRRIGSGLELVGALAVNVPGFPIPRPAGLVAGGSMKSLVASGMLAPEGSTQEDAVNDNGVTLSAADIAYLRRLATREARTLAARVKSVDLAKRVGV